MPPLRERGRDILILSKYFADEYCRENGKPKVTFSEDAQKKLMNYSYPGNIRELKSIIELSILMAENYLVESGNITFVSVDLEQDLLKRELSLEEYNREIIKHYLEKYDHKVIKAANKLKIAKSTMYRLIRKYELD
jgi:DNA-binding NtrC family response regulator